METDPAPPTQAKGSPRWAASLAPTHPTQRVDTTATATATATSGSANPGAALRGRPSRRDAWRGGGDPAPALSSPHKNDPAGSRVQSEVAAGRSCPANQFK